MKKIIFPLFFLSLGSSLLVAENAVFLELKSGDREIIKLSDKPKMSFDGENMLLESAIVSKTLKRKDIAKIKVDDYSSGTEMIFDTTKNPVWNFVSKDMIIAKGLQPGQSVDIYNISGNLILRKYADADGNAELSVSDLNSGIYLIKSKNSSFKFIK